MENIQFELIGYIAGICTAFCFMPQSIKTILTKDVQSLSLLSYIVYNFGMFCWIVYGIYLRSPQMIISNIIGITFAGSILFMILKYKDKKIFKRKKNQPHKYKAD